MSWHFRDQPRTRMAEGEPRPQEILRPPERTSNAIVRPDATGFAPMSRIPLTAARHREPRFIKWRPARDPFSSSGRDVMSHLTRRLGYPLVVMALAMAASAPMAVSASNSPPFRPERPWVKLCLKLKQMPQHRRIKCHFPPAPRGPQAARLAAEAGRRRRRRSASCRYRPTPPLPSGSHPAPTAMCGSPRTTPTRSGK